MNGIDAHSAHADPHSTLPLHLQPAQHHTPTLNGILHSHPVGEEEEPYTIKCVCGYHDDDGNTVLCEKCNSWQHIECYYPAKNVPEIHKCVDCAPRHLDAKRAAERQKRLREAQAGEDKKARRPAAKNPKKKPTRDVSQPNGLANGCSLHGDGATVIAIDRKINSPRDQPPPAKRPKTSHRVSGSTVSLNGSGNGIPRSAPGFSTPSATSPAKLTETSTTNGEGYLGPLFSPEFIGLYPNCLSFQTIASNSFHDIGVTGSLSSWLKDPDALADVTNGRSRAEVFQQYDRSIEELQAPGIESHVTEDTSVTVHGGHPTWHWLSIDRPIVSGAFVGELIGQIGRREDYIKEPANRWSSLRHPEPFVFFPPHLPIYIDTRVEGNIFRGIRRSCRPNVKMNILITDGMMYHFCFIAMREIAQGEEITIKWDLDEDVQRLVHASLSSGNIKKEGFLLEEEQYISNWVTGVLSNFGGCPCDRSLGGCAMDRFIRSNGLQNDLNLGTSNKTAKRKSKRSLKQTSPLSSGYATNSRATSETWNANEAEDEPAIDGRSASASSQSKPGSRDMTPTAHSSTDEPLSASGLEMSDRERRKLMQQEKLFEQLEHEQQSTKGRKKRISGGSAANTPAATSAKLSDSPISSFTSNDVGRRAPPDAPADQSKLLQRTRPSYSELCTQTDISGVQPFAQPRSAPLRRFSSLSQRILRKCHQARFRSESGPSTVDPSSSLLTPNPIITSHTLDPQQTTPGSPSSPLRHSMSNEEIKPFRGIDPESIGPQANSFQANGQEVDHDIDVHVSDTGSTLTKDYTEKQNTVGPLSQNPTRAAHPPIQPPPPPWPEEEMLDQSQKPKDSRRPRATGLHVQLPSAMQAQPTTPSTPSSGNPTSATGLAITQSPTAITPKPPLFSPALSNVVAHSSAKKRISFSDYLSRKGSAIHSHHAIPTSVSLATSGPVMPGPGAVTTSQLKSAIAPPTSSVDGMSPSTSQSHTLDAKKEEGTSSIEALKAN